MAFNELFSEFQEDSREIPQMSSHSPRSLTEASPEQIDPALDIDLDSPRLPDTVLSKPMARYMVPLWAP